MPSMISRLSKDAAKSIAGPFLATSARATAILSAFSRSKVLRFSPKENQLEWSAGVVDQARIANAMLKGGEMLVIRI